MKLLKICEQCERYKGINDNMVRCQINQYIGLIPLMPIPYDGKLGVHCPKERVHSSTGQSI